MSLTDLIQQQLGGSAVNQIAQQLGVSPSMAQSAITAAVPMILGGMARHASAPEGASTIQQAVQAHEGAAEDPTAVLQAGPPADVGAAGGLLGRIFGEQHDSVREGVQQASGLDPERAKKLLMMLSPIVLGMLAHRQFGGQSATQADPGQLAGTLRQEAHSAQQQAPHVGGLLGKLLGAAESHGA